MMRKESAAFSELLERKMETFHPMTSRWIKLTGRVILAEYVITSIHHVDEGLGFVFGSLELGSLLAPLTFGMVLLITLGLLELYQQTRARGVLAVFTLVSVLWWIVAIGLFDGLYNHTLSVLLVLARIAPGGMRLIYPTYQLPSMASIVTFPCDGTPFRFCTVTAATILYEGTGILQLVIGGLLTLPVYGLLRESIQSTSGKRLPYTVVGAVILAGGTSVGVIPLLGAFMSTDQLFFLIAGLPVLLVGVLAVVAVIGWRSRKSTATYGAPSMAMREEAD
jgi:hypothetical protein